MRPHWKWKPNVWPWGHVTQVRHTFRISLEEFMLLLLGTMIVNPTKYLIVMANLFNTALATAVRICRMLLSGVTLSRPSSHCTVKLSLSRLALLPPFCHCLSLCSTDQAGLTTRGHIIWSLPMIQTEWKTSQNQRKSISHAGTTHLFHTYNTNSMSTD